jgi:hypothetical protein
MDSCSESTTAAIVPYGGGIHMGDESMESSTSGDPFVNGDWVRLFVPGFGDVGAGIVKEVHPQGQWLGVPIPVRPWIYILVRPHSIKLEFQDLKFFPVHRGLKTLYDVQENVVLWRATDVVRSSGDPPMDPCPYIRQGAWFGLDVHRKDVGGLLLSLGRIICWMPDDHFQDGTLGEGFVGVTVLDIFVGNTEARMSHDRWPMSECWFPQGRSLKETADHFSAIPDIDDPLAYLGGRMKAPYRFVLRKPNVEKKESQYVRKTTDEEIRKVSSAKCCKRLCCQHFNQQSTLLVRQKYYLKSFEDRREYGISVGGQLHYLDGNRKLKYITLQGEEVCGTAWYIIHGVPKSTYHSYVEMFKDGIVSATHGNKGIKRPRIRTVQVTGTMKAIIDENADKMPHQMRGIGNGRVDTLKFLPAGRNWKRVQADANEVRLFNQFY